ncbi:MAG: helix-turn-helix transcriptional regulator [Georgenia sp.]
MAKHGPVNSPSDLGRILRDARQEAGLTQDEFADDLGVSRQYVSALESGKTSQHVDRIFGSLRLLGVRIEATWGRP